MWPLYKEGRGRPEKETDPSRLAGGGLNSKGTWEARHVQPQAGRPPHLPVKSYMFYIGLNIKIYMEASVGFRHVYHLDGFNTTSPTQGYVLGAASRCREGRWNPHPKDGEAVKRQVSDIMRILIATVPLLGQPVALFS